MADSIRSISARHAYAAHCLHGQRDSRKLTAPGRAKFLARFEREAIEAAEANGEELTEAEITRRAGHLRKAYFLKLALASAKARQKKAAR